MEGGLGKALLIVVLVLGVDAAGIYLMSVSGAQARAGGFEDTAALQDSTVSTKRAVKENQPFAYKPKQPAVRPPAEEPPPPKKPAAKAPVVDDFDPMLGERFEEKTIVRPPPEMRADGSVVRGTVRESETATIDAQKEKMRKGIAKKVNRIASRMRLDGRLREELLTISLDGLERVSQIRKNYTGESMSDSDRRYMNDQIRAANAETVGSIRHLLGDEKFKQFKKESRYYDKPTERVLDKMKDLEKQNKNLQKKVDDQGKQLKKIEPKRNSRRPSGRRSWQRSRR
jgi:DNA-binding protein YbaB